MLASLQYWWFRLIDPVPFQAIQGTLVLTEPPVSFDVDVTLHQVKFWQGRPIFSQNMIAQDLLNGKEIGLSMTKVLIYLG